MLVRLAHLVHRRRGRFVALWAVLTAFGVFATMQVSSRWFESFSIPGYSAYETNQKTVKTFGTGEQAPLVAVFHSKGDVTKLDITPAIAKAAAVNPGSRVSSYFDSHNVLYVSRDRHTTFAEIYPPGQNTFSKEPHIGAVRAALQANVPPGVEASLTGLLPLNDASSGGNSGGPSVLTEALIGGLGALVILLFVFDDSGGRNSARDCGHGDPQHVHGRVAADLPHERLDHRAVPDRTRRPRRRDRLRVADDLPLPRGARCR